MVVCKFFLQGTCKYGDYCKFEHQIPSSYTSFSDHSTSVLRPSNFGASQTGNTKPATNVDTNTLVKSVVTDMTSAEKGGQWLLSCYAPYKEKPAFPGFIDYSFEEIRLGVYEARKNNTLDQYKVQLQGMLQEAIGKIKALQNPSSEIVNILQRIYNTPPSSCSGVFSAGNIQNSVSTNPSVSNVQQTFGSLHPSGSVFDNANQNIFGSTPQASVFGANATNIFGGTTQSPSVFGGQIQNNSSSVFGSQANRKSIFTQETQLPSNTGSIFNSQSPTSGHSIFRQSPSTTGSIFGGQPTATGQSIFGAQPQQQSTNSPFAQQSNTHFVQYGAYGQQQKNGIVSNESNVNNSSSVFMKQPFIQATSIFTSQNQILPFGNAQPPAIAPQSSIFQTQTNQPLFDNSPKEPQPFGQPQVASHSQTTPTFASSFSNTTPINPQQGFGVSSAVMQQNPNAFVSSQQNQIIDESLYSKLEELTEEEKKWFESDDLDIANIPEKPPTFQMCFKT